MQELEGRSESDHQNRILGILIFLALTETKFMKSHSTTYYGNQQAHNEYSGCVNKDSLQNFIVQDSYSDGIYSPGGCRIYLNGALVFSGYNFKKSVTHAIPSKFNLFMLKPKTDNNSGDNL